MSHIYKFSPIPLQESSSDSHVCSISELKEMLIYVTSIFDSFDFFAGIEKTDSYSIQAIYTCDKEFEYLMQIENEWPKTWEEARKKAHF